jgi:hypothetical protein
MWGSMTPTMLAKCRYFNAELSDQNKRAVVPDVEDSGNR